jgi:hypothetical protein
MECILSRGLVKLAALCSFLWQSLCSSRAVFECNALGCRLGKLVLHLQSHMLCTYMYSYCYDMLQGLSPVCLTMP